MYFACHRKGIQTVNREYSAINNSGVKAAWINVLLSLPLSSSTDISVRTKRSKNSANQSRRQGCSLGTCTVHDLAHRLHQLNNKLKIGSAPVDKISPQGYGRRRRSLPAHRVTLTLEQGRLRPVWSITDSQVHKLEALLRRTWAGLCKKSWEQKRGSSSEWVSILLCSKILKMPQTPAKYCPAHFFPGMRTESERDWLHWVSCRSAM